MLLSQDCDTEIENEQEEHHAKTVYDLWNGKIVIVVYGIHYSFHTDYHFLLLLTNQ